MACIRVAYFKRNQGDKRSVPSILAEVIENYNTKQVNKCKLSSDKRDAVLMLAAQLPEFRDELTKHWLNLQCKDSAVPVLFLAKAWLSELHEPPLNKKNSPRHYMMSKNNVEKNLLWLRRCIGKFLDKF